jgi:hypothetical protein
MAREVFIDTSGFYAVLVGKDDRHAEAVDVFRGAEKEGRRFATTDYVLDETATLLMARGHLQILEPFFRTTLASKACSIVWTEPEMFSRTMAFFLKHRDQGWSFTDCLSFQVMKVRRLREALTKDEHFEKAGFRALLA